MDVFLQCKTVGLACRRSFISSKNWKGSSQWQANGKSQKTANVFLPCLWSTVAVPELYKTKVDSRLVECCFFFFFNYLVLFWVRPMLASKHKFQTGVFLQCSYCCLTF